MEPTQSDDKEPELADSRWFHHAEMFANTSFWAVARRLPAIVRESVSIAWTASRRDTIAAIGLTLVAGVMTTLGLLATATVLQELFATGPTPDKVKAALPALTVAALATATRGGLQIAAGWAQARMAPQINFAIEIRLFEATTAVELGAFDDAGFAEDMDRARERGMIEAASLVNSTVDLVTGAVGVVATAAAVTVIEPLLLPCLVLASLPSAVTAVKVARREYVTLLSLITRRRRLWMLANLMANRHTAAEVRTYQMRGFLLGEYRRIMKSETDALLSLVRAQTATRLAGISLSGLATGGLYAALGGLLLLGNIPLAAAATALIALQQARMSQNTAIFAANNLYEDALYYGDYRSFLDRAESHLPKSGGTKVDGFDEIRLTDVRLKYPDTETPAVDGVSMTLRRGQVIALVGENGSGKSSLAKLIAGLYEPVEGEIRWDGVSVADLDRASLASQVAVTTQDLFKFPFTAAQNILIGRHDRTGDGPSITTAARAAAAHDMIEKLPFGYRTLLDRAFKQGHDLSGGEWQRLVSARAFYRDAALLICDEPSSALDARAEHAIFQQLRAHPNRAIVLITHRLANVRHADHIYVLHEGRVVQHGDHDSLMAEGGLYKELFELQASGYRAAGV
ncbi:ABC transporter ATP-binding protein [Virgisporangium ochraceum]|uniref:Multidrug ABC transporter permease n=1 Tax=Virgisporangium ochraceum TaxID=65505 RepID=A0A8J3ZTQ3_9ACTN|nr:ABC transporter ATP-binding protein [Virgisporangium ochraceum]GIJ68898.1 multidrug ABC transporter permease [Virgisporangium ochraceum]